MALVQVLDEPRLDRPPPEQFAGQRARCRLVDREDLPQPAEILADKREVLFYGMDSLRDLLARAVADASASATPMDAVGAALQAMGAMMQENPERVRLRDAVVSANAELRERELIKLAALASAVVGALRDRGIPEPAANLAAETGIAVFKVAFARWISEPGQPDLPGILRESMEELRGVLTGWLAGSASPS